MLVNLEKKFSFLYRANQIYLNHKLWNSFKNYGYIEKLHLFLIRI